MSDQSTMPVGNDERTGAVAALPPARPRRPSSRERVQQLRALTMASRFPVIQLVVFALVFGWASVSMEGFTSVPSLRATFVIAALLALAALGQTLVILIGGLDMAVPGYMTVGAVSAVVLPMNHGWSLPTVALFVVLVTGAAGAAIGGICHFLEVQPLVVSLGMSAVLTGGTLIATDANFMGTPPEGLSELTSTMGTTFGLPIPPVLSIAVVTIVVVGVVLSRTVVGRRLYATGANPLAAGEIQIRVGLIWIGTFAVGAAITGLVGMLVAGFSSGATLSVGEPYFFSGLAAVLVGGTALGSAHGDFTRTVLGALTLTVLSTILAGMGMDEGGRRMLFGALIIVVVLLYGRDRRLRDRL